MRTLDAAVARLGCPAVLKTASFGYDGKGQVKVARAEDAPAAWEQIDAPAGGARSVHRFRPRSLGRRGARRSTARSRTTASSRTPSPSHSRRLGGAGRRAAAASRTKRCAIARATLEALDVVGVLCVELFLTRDGRLLINELAPRPHNSGHLTFDAAVTSQFEQQLRAVCGLPLGSTELLRPAAMANLLGDLWATASRTGRPRALPRRQTAPLRQVRPRAPAARWATSRRLPTRPTKPRVSSPPRAPR